MILNAVTLRHFGGFYTSTRIDLDPKVTIFTGANDTGKSCALKAIRILCARQRLSESDVHKDRFGRHPGTWDTDPDLSLNAELEITEASIREKLVGGSPRAGDIVSVRYQGNIKGRDYNVYEVRRPKSQISPDNVRVAKLPQVAIFDPASSIRDIIDLADPTPSELQFLRLAFGAQFEPKALLENTPLARAQHLDRAIHGLNNKLDKFFPKALHYQFKIFEIGGSAKTLGVSLVDAVQGYAELGLRGAGVRRLVSLMVFLLSEVNPEKHSIVLLDEPENSLHADAQHQVRRTLEQISENPKVQVIYATHSPAMVNPAHPERVRVFSRKWNGDVGTSQVERLSHSENFQAARISLGITPCDSLLYGLVTIIVEGETEARCLAPLLRRLDREGVSGFENLSSLLDSCHFVCGWGDSIFYYCKLARDQNGRPIAFLDGDKKREAAKLVEAGVPTIELPKQTEFEEIVPLDRYIAALAEECIALDISSESITAEGFRAWSTSNASPAQSMFSKRVDSWLQQTIGRQLKKHSVMERAIRLTRANEFNVESLAKLAEAIRNQM